MFRLCYRNGINEEKLDKRQKTKDKRTKTKEQRQKTKDKRKTVIISSYRRY